MHRNWTRMRPMPQPSSERGGLNLVFNIVQSPATGPGQPYGSATPLVFELPRARTLAWRQLTRHYGLSSLSWATPQDGCHCQHPAPWARGLADQRQQLSRCCATAPVADACV